MKKNLFAVLALTLAVMLGACSADAPSDGPMTAEELGVTKQATTLVSPPSIWNLWITSPTAGWQPFGPYSWSRVGAGSTTPGSTTSYAIDGQQGMLYATLITETEYTSCTNPIPGGKAYMVCKKPGVNFIPVFCPTPYVSNANLTDPSALGIDFGAGTAAALTDWFGPGLYQPNGGVTKTTLSTHHAVYAQPGAGGGWQVVCEFEPTAVPLIKAL